MVVALPPGQRAFEGFPRFGADLSHPAPTVPDHPSIEVTGVVTVPLVLPVTELATLPRRDITAGLHCVAGWSSTGLRWSGVAFADFYRLVVEPHLPQGTTPTHACFRGLDDYQSIVVLEDVLRSNVLIADHLGGRPLTASHGAPVRLVSPDQYGFISTKHLCRIELHVGEPAVPYHPTRRIQTILQLVKPHPRARVWKEERHRYLPAWAVRPAYHALVRLFALRHGRRLRP